MISPAPPRYSGAAPATLGNDSIIDMGDDNSITVAGVTGLTADDFLFA